VENGPNTRNKGVLLSTIIVFYSFFTFGFSENLRGSTLPLILEDLNLNYALGGSLFFVTYLGFMIAVLLLGFLSERIGKRSLLFIGSLCTCAGSMGYSIASTYGPLLLSTFAVGVGMGTLEVGGNAIMVSLHPVKKARYLSFLTLFYGAGATVVPAIAAAAFARGIGWRPLYRYAALLSVVLFVAAFFERNPELGTPPDESKEAVPIRELLRKDRVLYYLFLLFGVGTEVGIVSWLVVFLRDVKALSLPVSSAYLSIFYGMIIAGRVLGSILIDRIGHNRSMLIATVAVLISLTTGVFGPSFLTVLFPLAGFFISIIFPTTTAAIADDSSVSTGAILGVLFTFSTAGAMLTPMAIGFVAEQVSVIAGFSLVIATCLMMLLIILGIMLGTRRRSRTHTEGTHRESCCEGSK
jgi:MFS transporter, FHS family, glucose/mannose:H+ symporter